MQRQPEQSESSPPHACEGIFATTHWSVVLEAGREDLPEARGALETLCRAYWYPLYAFVRRRGYDPEAARDFTQEFFYRLLTSDWIARADRTKGRFRTFLLCGMQNLLANEWQKANRLKRGAGREIVPLDGLEAEGRYKVEPTDLASADKLFERRWALTLLDRVLARLQSEQEELMAAERFESLRGVLLGEPSDEGYATLAHRFGVTESTVKSWVHRLRRRYRELLHEEVARTVSSPEEVQDELRHLFRVLAA
ncbi:MAG: sigma-70 family RNA polymerase sigma factor [Verrucomicrobia bacterium]|nr:sigma-70 family RNA polymerase sigma factor [Verrucomicrobiota bacterium]